MNGCVLYTAVAIEIDAREYAANSSTQFATIATLPSSANAIVRFVSRSRRNRPSAAQMISIVAPPNRQRKNTTFIKCCRDDTTSQPIVPDISIATTISSAPRRASDEAGFEAM